MSIMTNFGSEFSFSFIKFLRNFRFHLFKEILNIIARLFLIKISVSKSIDIDFLLVAFLLAKFIKDAHEKF